MAKRFRSIDDLLRTQSGAQPSRTAIIDLLGRDLTYGDLWAVAAHVGGVLQGFGISEKDIVAISLPNGPEMATAFLSVACVSSAAPMNPQLTRPEFSYYLSDLGVRALLVGEEDTTEASAAAGDLGIPVIRIGSAGAERAGAFSILSDVHPLPGALSPREPRDVALYLHTSGTTSRPKMVPLTHRNLCASAFNVAKTLKLRQDDRCMNVMPLFHIHGLVAALLSSLAAGASIVCTTGFDAPRFFTWFERVQPTWYTAVPTMHQAILARAGEAEQAIVSRSPLRFVRSSSASLAPSVLSRTEEVLGVPVVEAYGMTEAAHQMTSNPLPPLARKPGSVGVPAGPDVAIADASGQKLAAGAVGEVIIRGENVIAGYRGISDTSEVFHEGGWFRTGDQGYLDDEGYLFLTGRLKEIINRGGETIAPREIDEALLEHPSVSQAVAFSIPDERLGEEVGAAVVLGPGGAVDRRALQDFLSERLSYPKLPKRIVFVDEIPKGPTGKLQRIGLAERLGITGTRSDVSGDVPEQTEGLNELVEAVLEVWRSVLKVDDVNPDDHFLDVGGDSVTALQVVAHIRDLFTIDLSLASIVEASSARAQAILIADSLRQADGSV